ncbi:MAG: DNA cytosine methyltransferase [Methanotrichaceae archaeon]
MAQHDINFEGQNSLRPVVLDLFCGAGGMSLGFQMAGYNIGLGLEKERYPYETHCYNFNGRCHLSNIYDIKKPINLIKNYKLGHIDVIIGGPPCQGFSRVGRGKIRSLRNDPQYIHDPRNQLYKEFMRFIDKLRPLYFVMENVPEMRCFENSDGLLIDHIIGDFEDMGYNADWEVLKANHYGVPQTRRRLFIIGNRLGRPISWPKKSHVDKPVTVWQAISDLPIVPPKHRIDEMPYVPRCQLNEYQQLMRLGAGNVLYNHQTRGHNEQDLAAFELMAEGSKYTELSYEYKRYRDDIFKDKYRKLYRDQPSWTIEAHIGKDGYRHIYPSRSKEPEPPRTISVREAARLQSFPDRFRFRGPFTRQFYQLGNAVPPLMARAVAEYILPDLINELQDINQKVHAAI